MAKTLRDIAAKDKFAGKDKTTKTEPSIDQSNLYPWNAPDGVKFIKKHKIDKKDYPYDADAAFTGGKVKQTSMKGHGYKDPADDKIYESKMSCEGCGKEYEGESCGCGKAAPEAKAGKKGLLVDKKKKLQEVLTKKTSSSKVISDFVHSDNPKFAGKSKKERVRMALGAYYGMHPEKSNKVQEETEELDENLGKSMKKFNRWYGNMPTMDGGGSGPRDIKRRVQNADPDFLKHLASQPKGKLGGPAELQRRLAVKHLAKTKVQEELAVPMLEDGKKKKTKTQKESAPADTPITYPSGNVGDMPGRI